MRWKYHLFEVQSSVMQVCSTDRMPQDEDLQSLPVDVYKRQVKEKIIKLRLERIFSFIAARESWFGCFVSLILYSKFSVFVQ